MQTLVPAFFPSLLPWVDGSSNFQTLISFSTHLQPPHEKQNWKKARERKKDGKECKRITLPSTHFYCYFRPVFLAIIRLRSSSERERRKRQTLRGISSPSWEKPRKIGSKTPKTDAGIVAGMDVSVRWCEVSIVSDASVRANRCTRTLGSLVRCSSPFDRPKLKDYGSMKTLQSFQKDLVGCGVGSLQTQLPQN